MEMMSRWLSRVMVVAVMAGVVGCGVKAGETGATGRERVLRWADLPVDEVEKALKPPRTDLVHAAGVLATNIDRLRFNLRKGKAYRDPRPEIQDRLKQLLVDLEAWRGQILKDDGLKNEKGKIDLSKLPDSDKRLEDLRAILQRAREVQADILKRMNEELGREKAA
jgi:hypothetical protein